MSVNNKYHHSTSTMSLSFSFLISLFQRVAHAFCHYPSLHYCSCFCISTYLTHPILWPLPLSSPSSSSTSLSPLSPPLSLLSSGAAVRAAAAPIQVRTWFGFGMAKEADELEAEKQPFRPLYNRVVEDDTEEYLSPG